MSGPPTTPRRILLSAFAALVIGLGALTLISGFSSYTIVRILQVLAVFAAGAAVVGGAAVFVMIRLAGWRDPVSEEEFDAIVERAERLAAEGSWGGGDEELGPAVEADDEGFFDPYDEADFRALVRAAVDDLPLEAHRALEHVAVVVSDGGRKRRAYGLYEGDTVARDYFHDRIVIFRDTLLRDFGHDPALLRAQVTRTVRHELAHHLGWDENGVRGLGL
ncbi:MAG TPA: metallopeptidase family protein [Solirubrobacteraceae bacterium]|jgi:predicted Zn-dependent protease with MMP-like domain|nr:metallopeptidase family protein [Solirubrobacteraceae bacterium]